MSLIYTACAWAQVRLFQFAEDRSGQGTVEYVGLMLLLATVLTAVVAAARGKDGGITNAIVGKLKETIESVGGK